MALSADRVCVASGLRVCNSAGLQCCNLADLRVSFDCRTGDACLKVCARSSSLLCLCLAIILIVWYIECDSTHTKYDLALTLNLHRNRNEKKQHIPPCLPFIAERFKRPDSTLSSTASSVASTAKDCGNAGIG